MDGDPATPIHWRTKRIYHKPAGCRRACAGSRPRRGTPWPRARKSAKRVSRRPARGRAQRARSAASPSPVHAGRHRAAGALVDRLRARGRGRRGRRHAGRREDDAAEARATAQRSRKTGAVLRRLRETAGIERRRGRQRDRSQGPGAARARRERQGGAAVRDHPAPRVGARPQRSDLVRHALHALLQSGSLEDAGVARHRPVGACRPGASGSSRTSTARAMPRAASPTKNSPKC